MPSWVEPGSLFHIRIALDKRVAQRPLTNPDIATALIESVRVYEQKQRWHVTLFLIMPDHVHGLLSFPFEQAMSKAIGDWKRFHARERGIIWQDGYFDHRLRDDGRGEQLEVKLTYIRNNPVAARLCDRAEEWSWVYPTT